MFTPNRCEHDRIHRNLSPGAACDSISKAEADEIVTPRRAPTKQSIASAATKNTASPDHFTPTSSSVPVQPGARSTASTVSDHPATPTPAPRGSTLTLSAPGELTPQATQESAVEQQPDDDFDIGENINVASRRSSPASSGEGSNIANEPSQPDFEMGDNIRVAPHQSLMHERAPSSTSTVLVPETPFVNGRPVPQDAGPPDRQDPPQRRISSAAREAVPAPASNDMAQHMTDLEIQHLRRSRAQYAHELEESTGLVDRLQTQRQIHEADAAIKGAMIGQLGEDREKAWQRTGEAEEQRRRTTMRLGLALALLVCNVLAYACWCVYMWPEMEYIRVRRIQVLRHDLLLLTDGVEECCVSPANHTHFH